MTTGVQITDPTTMLKDAAALMRQGDFGLLPVGGNDRLVGTITDRDITIRAVAEGKDPSTTPVREAMSQGIRYCFDDQTVEEAARPRSAGCRSSIATSAWSVSWRSPISPPRPGRAGRQAKR